MTTCTAQKQPRNATPAAAKRSPSRGGSATAPPRRRRTTVPLHPLHDRAATIDGVRSQDSRFRVPENCDPVFAAAWEERLALLTEIVQRVIHTSEAACRRLNLPTSSTDLRDVPLTFQFGKLPVVEADPDDAD